MALRTFYNEQLNQISKHGYKLFFYKISKFFKLLPIFIPALILVFLVRIFSPLVIVRFFPIDFGRLGGVYPLVYYLRLKRAGEFKFPRSIDLFFIATKFKHNKQWLKLWKKSVVVLMPSLLWQSFYFLNNLFRGSEKYKIPNFADIVHNGNTAKNNSRLFNNIKKESLERITKIKDPLIYFKKKEILIGKNYLKKIGTSDYNFICFSARDSAYLNQFDNTRDWSYHNFRNFSIENCLFSMREMSKKNFYCFRMGSVVSNKLSDTNSKIIDYANSDDQSDFLDIYLGSRCFFSVCPESGISVIPEVFNRPIVFVNWPGLENAPSSNNNSLFIPKKFFYIEKQRFLTFKEILELNFANNFSSKTLKDSNIKLIENTPQEINEVVLEMYKRLNGTWIPNKEEEILQREFWSLFDHPFVKSSTFRIGSDFLKKNQHFLY